jgi:hypothetical protein
MIPGPTCANCGHDLTNHNTACAACDRCDECMPGTCWECTELRNESEADKALRYAIENEVCS